MRPGFFLKLPPPFLIMEKKREKRLQSYEYRGVRLDALLPGLIYRMLAI